MKRKYITIVAAVCALFVTSCGGGWSATEEELINSSRMSRMRVTTVDNEADSLLLRSECLPLTAREVASPIFGRLVASMVESVNDPENRGVGIAAPQVGVLRRVVVVQRFDKAGTPFEVYVNPVIESYGEEWSVGSEGCLSVPGLRGEVRRATSITLGWRDPVDFEPRREVIEGFTAVIFQHEIDHLGGVLYTDRADSVNEE